MAIAIPKELATLVDALHDGVVDLAKDAAVSQLDHWHDLLAEAHKPELKAISRDVDALRKLLGAEGDLDGKKIGATMVRLADHIDGLNEDAAKGIKTRLHTLGRLLRSEGQELSGHK